MRSQTDKVLPRHFRGVQDGSPSFLGAQRSIHRRVSVGSKTAIGLRETRQYVPGHVVQVFQSPRAGVPAYVASLTAGLLERGWQVTIFAPPANSAMDQLRSSGARVVAVGLVRHPSPSDAVAVRALSRLCRGGVDVIHGHSSKASLLAGCASRLTGVPSVYSPHAWAFEQQKPFVTRLAYATLERAMGRCHQEIIAVADSERHAAQRAGIRPLSGAVRLVHTGLPQGPLPPDRVQARRSLGLPPNDIVVAWVGRRAAQKRPQDLPPLAAALAPEGIRLIAAGWGLAGATEAGALAAHGGRVLPDGTDPLDLYAAADVFVQTSAWEANPLSVLEAMRAGLPVVAYRVGGLPELVEDGITGYLVEPNRIESLTSRVIALARSPLERARMGAAAQRRLQSGFRFDTMLDAIESTYWSAVSASHGREDHEPRV
jgi:glycosyltransferase involved in cell wall biosynthesis